VDKVDLSGFSAADKLRIQAGMAEADKAGKDVDVMLEDGMPFTVTPSGEICALCSTRVTQYVRVNVDQVFCLTDVVHILGQAHRDGYIQGKQITTLAEFWTAAHDITFASIGY
jgi:hypothetical protein